MKTPTATPRRRAATPPAWARAAALGAEAAAALHTRNPYAYGSQCWVIFEHARGATLPYSRDTTATLPASVSSVCSVGTSSASASAAAA